MTFGSSTHDNKCLGVTMETQDGVLISLCNSDQDKNKGLTLINGKDGFPLKNISLFAAFYLLTKE